MRTVSTAPGHPARTVSTAPGHPARTVSTAPGHPARTVSTAPGHPARTVSTAPGHPARTGFSLLQCMQWLATCPDCSSENELLTWTRRFALCCRVFSVEHFLFVLFISVLGHEVSPAGALLPAARTVLRC